MPEEEILKLIEKLPLKEAIAYLVTHGIKNFSVSKYQKIRKYIQDKWNEKHYGFSPNPKEASYLKKISDRAYFQEFGRLLPKHQYADSIRTGYLIHI